MARKSQNFMETEPSVKSPFQKKKTLQKISQFHLISLCGNFVERHSIRKVSGESPETLRVLCLFTKLPHQEIGWNYGSLHSEDFGSDGQKLRQHRFEKFLVPLILAGFHYFVPNILPGMVLFLFAIWIGICLLCTFFPFLNWFLFA